jgi:hypothetical protein
MMKQGYEKAMSLAPSVRFMQAHAAVVLSQSRVYSRFHLSDDGWCFHRVLD